MKYTSRQFSLSSDEAIVGMYTPSRTRTLKQNMHVPPLLMELRLSHWFFKPKHIDTEVTRGNSSHLMLLHAKISWLICPELLFACMLVSLCLLCFFMNPVAPVKE